MTVVLVLLAVLFGVGVGWWCKAPETDRADALAWELDSALGRLDRQRARRFRVIPADRVPADWLRPAPAWLREPAAWDHPATRPILGANAESWLHVVDLRDRAAA